MKIALKDWTSRHKKTPDFWGLEIYRKITYSPDLFIVYPNFFGKILTLSGTI